MINSNVPGKPVSVIPLREFLVGSGPRRLAAWVLGVSAFAALFAVSFLGAFHQPKPYGMPIAVVAPSQAVTTLQKRLDRFAPESFALERYVSVEQATTSLRNGVVDAVWLPPAVRASGFGPGARPVARLFTASALGETPTEVVQQTFITIGRADGETVTVSDLVPLPAEDPAGVSAFFFGLGVFLPSFLGSIVMILLLVRRTPALATIAALLVLAGCVGLIDVAVVDAGFGALVGHFGTLIGIAVLASLAFSAPTVAAGRLLGPLGALLALLVFVVLGAPASGGPFGTAFLPAFQRSLAPGLPLTNAVEAVRNASYFGGHGLSGYLRTLAVWAGVGLLLLGGVALSESKRRRALSPPTLSNTSDLPTRTSLTA